MEYLVEKKIIFKKYPKPCLSSERNAFHHYAIVFHIYLITIFQVSIDVHNRINNIRTGPHSLRAMRA